MRIRRARSGGESTRRNPAISLNVVLRSNDLNRASLRQRRADRVVAGGPLVPARADAQITLVRRLEDPRMTRSHEHIAVGVAQGQHVLGLAELVAQSLDNGGARA